MFSQDLNARLDLGTQALVPARALALKYFAQLDSLTIERKSNSQDTVSRADKEVEELLRSAIAAQFPEDGILGEEYGLSKTTSDWVWVIDPIDGTANYLHGMTEWCISLGLMYRNEIVGGLIDVPCRDELFRAGKEQGATLNGQEIKVSAEETLAEGLVGLGANLMVAPDKIGGFVTALLSQGGMFQKSGSGALSLAHVACGRLVGYHEYHIRLWDVCAAVALIREAGGIVGSFDPGEGLSQGFVITAGTEKTIADIQRLSL